MEKRSTVALAASSMLALIVFCLLELVLFRASTSHQSLLWTMLLRAAPSVAGGFAAVVPWVWARGRGWRGYLRALRFVLFSFAAVDVVIAFFYGWGQAVA